MHHLLLITLGLPAVATSLDARTNTHSRLLDDDSFCGDGGRFGAPLCDWFVIGGRWSGLLRRHMLGRPFEEAFENQFPEFAGRLVSEKLIEQNRTGLNRFWKRFGGHDGHPLTRSDYEELGFEDDAMLIDQALYDGFLKRFAGQDADGGEFADLDGESVGESFIGRKWLIVVDYHN